ncbi:leucine-rich repeat receptor-like serine/threonine/tyrosine-protein kinase SOBIR1 [Salvia splendens]|nr:leucine-rich repeat receptor-like serine/threonine/tyrosine-protein kinase SOBIR1 [Salvia splendens]
MEKQIRNYIRECDICQRYKYDNSVSPGLLQPLPIPEEAWSQISLDFIEDNVFKLHGLPNILISDRDKVFMSKFWSDFFKLQGVELHMSTAYHPQSDGQTEVVNRCLDTYLRCMCGDQPYDCSKWLSLAEFWYNTSFHSAIETTPFEALYGYPPPIHIPYFRGDSTVHDVNESLMAREAMLEVLKHHLGRAQKRMKQQHDKHRSDRTFALGDWVYLKLQPYRQNTLRDRQFHKLSPRYFGPFKIIDKYGKVAYKLSLPTDSKIHLVYHRVIIGNLLVAAGVIGGILSALVFSLLFKLLLVLIHGRNRDTGIKIFSPLIKKPEDLSFLEKEDGLSSLNVIGKGGCGEVYKAVLPGSDGKEIAIKKIIQSPTDQEELTEEDSKLLNKKMRQIRSEIKTVGEIRHRNLLPLLAHLPRPDCHYLVYEYMKNGSVHDYLVGVARGEKELDWPARYKIIMGIAAGLEYLHMNHTPRIIHRDLKPANVLLDDEMEARIADFGLAKSVPDANTHMSTSNIAGTAGYIAPEYHQTFKFTEKCDMYSFGVVLAAVVMGKMPSDEFFQNTEEVSLVKWMRNVMTSDDPKRAIDPKLMGSGYEEQMLLALKVACFCTLDNPKERPDSKNARTMLSQIKH